eukprot:27240-Chlamydomonas_euryale.AAC.2
MDVSIELGVWGLSISPLYKAGGRFLERLILLCLHDPRADPPPTRTTARPRHPPSRSAYLEPRGPPLSTDTLPHLPGREHPAGGLARRGGAGRADGADEEPPQGPACAQLRGRRPG